MFKGYDKRKPIKCDFCGNEMVFSKEAWSSSDGTVIYLKYVCPSRSDERGCGKSKIVSLQRDSNIK